ncbi:MAG: MarR family transcriptional regulator [Vagococcus sp.]|uniref:MarR family winged helix-turn-helix transcriptional regulator n=1 Tax=Vagococcus sp. TaxID=1933889 RepID=UPI002FCC8CCC
MSKNINFDIYQSLHSISRNMHHLAHYIGGEQGEMQDLGRTLNFIKDTHQATAKELGKYFNIKSSSVTVKVNKLVEQGYIKKTRDENDLRVFFLELTEKGRAKCEELNTDTQDLVQDIFVDLTQNQKNVLLDELKLIEKRLAEKKEGWEK